MVLVVRPLPYSMLCCSYPCIADLTFFHGFHNRKWYGRWCSLIRRSLFILLELLHFLKKWSNTAAGQVSLPLVSTDSADHSFDSNIPTSHLVVTSIGFAIVVTAICHMLATILLEIGVDFVQLNVDILYSISNHSNKLLIR